MTISVNSTEEVYPFAWQVTSAQDGEKGKLGVRVGEHFELNDLFRGADDSDERATVHQVGYDMVIKGMQLMGATEDERRLYGQLILHGLANDD